MSSLCPHGQEGRGCGGLSPVAAGNSEGNAVGGNGAREQRRSPTGSTAHAWSCLLNALSLWLVCFAGPGTHGGPPPTLVLPEAAPPLQGILEWLRL